MAGPVTGREEGNAFLSFSDCCRLRYQVEMGAIFYLLLWCFLRLQNNGRFSRKEKVFYLGVNEGERHEVG